MKMKNILFLSAFTLGMLTATAGFAQTKVQYTLEQRKAMQKGAAEANKAYGALRKEVMDLLKKNDLKGAESVAQKMVAVAQESEKKYANYHRLYLSRSYADIADAFAEKRLFGAKYTVKWYEKALAADKEPNVSVAQQYGIFLKKYYLADEAKIKKLITGALDGGPHSVGFLINYVGKCTDYYTYEQLFDYMMKHAAQIKEPEKRTAEQKRAMEWYAGKMIELKKYDKAISFCNKNSNSAAKDSLAIYKANALCQMDFQKGIAEYEKVIKAAAEKSAPRMQFIQQLERNTYRFYLPADPVYLKKIIAVAKDGMTEEKIYGKRIWRSMAAARVNAGLKLGDTADLKATLDILRKMPDLETKNSDMLKIILYAEGKMAYDAEDYAAAIAPLEKMNALFNGKYHHLQVGNKEGMLDMIIRSHCAVGNYKKALSYKDVFMKNVSRPTRNRYKVYFEFLEKRTADQK